MPSTLPSLTSVTTSQIHRPRRRRRTDALRRLVREHQLDPADLIQPLFVVHGSSVEREITSMPGVCHLSVDDALDREVDRVRAVGIPAVLLFGLPSSKDEIGSENFAEDGIVQRALRRIRSNIPISCSSRTCAAASTPVTATAACCATARVDNDATLEILGRVAVTHAQAGADIVAPSGMMDGMVAAIRARAGCGGHSETAPS